MNTLNLCPMPRSMVFTDGTYNLMPGSYILLDNNIIYTSVKIAGSRHPLTKSLCYAVSKLSSEKQVAISFTHALSMEHEAYKLIVNNTGIEITYGDNAGAFYAMSTLVQIIENVGGVIPCLKIEDSPVFPTRGYMLDIGRNKVPKLEEMLSLVDWLASMKINHVELYIEGIPFEYPSFPHMWHGRDILTGDDILALDVYCRDRFIDLVPTQNHFGHMDHWLLKEYRHLAECPDGFHFGGGYFPDPRCLNPLNPDSEELVRKLETDLLPYFSSNNFNICCDETFELGLGHTKEECEKYGKGRVYLDFLLKVINIARENGKQMLFWDDIIKHYPELLPKIPSDVIALEWGYYADRPRESDCELMQKSGVRYFTCPGTGAWNTLLGKTNQMLANICNAAELGQKYGAEGLLNTDWGDSGHLQSLPTSYSGIAYGAAMSWSPTESKNIDLAAMLDTLVFKDAAGVMGHLVLDAGNYFEIEGIIPKNITHSFQLLVFGLDNHSLADNTKPEDYIRVSKYLDELTERLSRTDMRCDKSKLILDEYRLALSLVNLAQSIGLYHHAVKSEDINEQQLLLTDICKKLPILIGNLKTTWLERNRYSYLDESLRPLNDMVITARTRLSELINQ